MASANAAIKGDQDPAPPALLPVAPGIFVHVTATDGAPASNGLLVVGHDGALLVDIAATTAETRRLIDAVERLTRGAPLQVYVTEARPERLGGLAVVHERGLRSLGHETTLAAAMARGLPLPRSGWNGETLAFEVGARQIEAFHPGAALTRGNTVVYVGDADLLHGGSLIGGDDDVAAALTATRARFGAPAIVIPGRGAPGDHRLLSHPAHHPGEGRDRPPKSTPCR
ncbi:hypothetical protein L2U69_01405 [Zavarzinia compransoris]|uniref:hypothetical protein n=1 Tax=Zavarzinia marina TaxID=2911065 RepID=UPI001F396D9E|nr:hypothetical protein [Zavarzinia marina]MCF4164301.1 hypothetical protein [Zavarzinia marina]